ncbi:MAG: ABC transporter permease [Bacteroidetes bacterium]|nr:ABC transporter permease [Bacteroidota bacterium]
MLRNYIKIAVRNLTKNKVYAFINLLGLSIGLACVLVIVSYVNLELSYDKFHQHYKEIYRVTEYRTRDGKTTHSATSFSPMAELIEAHVPAVENVVRMYPVAGFLSADKINKFKETDFVLVDSLFFKTFTFEPIQGSLSGALDDPFAVVITENKAIQYFGKTDVVGKALYFENATQTFMFNVKAVIKDFPQNAHFTANFLASFSSIRTMQPWYNNWFHPAIYIYALLKPGFNGHDLDMQIATMGKQHFPDHVKESRTYESQNLAEIHLYSNLTDEWGPNSSKTYVNLFALIAVFILLIACINFMNLATAQATQRAKEVGMRKVMGAERRHLAGQFLGESFIMTLLSFVIAFAMAQLVLRIFFNQLIGKELSVGYLLSGYNFFWTLLSVVLVSLLAGSYPAFYLSGFNPILSLKGKVIKIAGLGSVRKFMVTFQFFISCLLIIGTAIVLSQINLLRNKSLGFDKEQMVAISLIDRKDQINYRVLKDALLSESSIVDVALSSTLPGREEFYAFPIAAEGVLDEEMTMKSLAVDEDYIDTYKLEVIAGRKFSKDISSDVRGAFILNEAAARKLGWDEPLGKDFTITIHAETQEIRKGKVIGVVRDFHFQSLYNAIDPLVIYLNASPFYSNFLNVKLGPGNWEDAIALLKNKWKEFSPNKPFEFYFLDEELKKVYDSEVRIGRIFSAFAGLSIVISCLGLFGLSAFSAQLRVKEIGIRKVMGANIGGILILLFREYITLIIVANVIAWPLGWYVSTEWLSSFPYHTGLNIGIFIMTLLGALIIALATVSYQSMKAAVANPAKSLKIE